MQSWKQWTLLGLILVVALALRWTGIDWDGYHHYHPDERYITWVATTIEWPSSLAVALDPTQSPLNPFYWYPDAASQGIEVLQDEARDFAYGHVPLYLGVAATRLVERLAAPVQAVLPADWLVTADIFNARDAVEFRHLTAVARALTGLFDAGTIAVIFLLGRRLFDPLTGLLAAVFLALNVMHIQLAHFFAVDPYLTFFSITALAFMVRAIYKAREERESEERGRRCFAMCSLLFAALFAGLAVGAKFSAVLLLPALGAAVWFALPEKRLRRLLAVMSVVILTFVITNPYALLDMNCELLSPAISVGPINIPVLDWRSCYLANIIEQGAMVRGHVDLGFTRQYNGTLPFLYPIEMQLRWGMGWPLGLFAFAAFAWAIWKALRPVWRRLSTSDHDVPGPFPAQTLGLIVLMIWAIPFFITTSGFYVKFMRYLLPLTPLLMLFSAAFLLSFKDLRVRVALLVLVLVPTAVYAESFMNIYRSEHPWSLASRWVYENVPAGTLIASEQWDDSLPTTMLVNDEMRLRAEYRDRQLTWLTGPDERDNEEKLQKNLQILEEAEYVTLLSNRVYGVVPRLQERYELSHFYHQLLFDGTLGFEPVYVNTRMPGILGFHLKPDPFVWPGLNPPGKVADYLASFRGISGGRFDESFTVYDQPLVIVFQKTEPMTAAEMRAQFPNP
jgi:Dolichyl-phosphate-mannose-protein mannosyltransferase